MEWSVFFESWIWLGFASLGFAILFNVPLRTLWVIFLLGALGGTLKLVTMKMGGGIILGSFFGAMLVGFLSISAAHFRHAPPFVFAIPSVIPMVPGAFAYRTMLGIIKLTGDVDHATFTQLLDDTVTNGLKAFFVLMALALGVSAPMLLTRRESAKQIKVPLKIDGLIKK
ncbi:threonine/serine exporter family protein [Maribellus maritimus]|uniref:threonine/serine exporter family protein n=1 Tax=Maribellus maritimus TaxID=2870838 RepID=UPI001EEB26F4|nr:threonine/serine exporter family protein [Maribellus maritimus]MCG6190528.1 threonine/serine exporter family protein [Maribellus maritimus]